MTAPTITALPAAPLRSQTPANFTTTAENFVDALPDLVTEINAFGTYLNGYSPGGAYTPGGTDVALADGGTGASTAAGARTNLSVYSQAEVDALVEGATVSEETGTTYTFDLADSGTVIEFNNASAITATIPPNSSVAFPIGTWIELHQKGAGTLTVAAGSGVTLQSRGLLTDTAGQYAIAGIRKVATNTWRLTGDLA